MIQAKQQIILCMKETHVSMALNDRLGVFIQIVAPKKRQYAMVLFVPRSFINMFCGIWVIITGVQTTVLKV